jgi:hypothetical protein
MLTIGPARGIACLQNGLNDRATADATAPDPVPPSAHAVGIGGGHLARSASRQQLLLGYRGRACLLCTADGQIGVGLSLQCIALARFAASLSRGRSPSFCVLGQRKRPQRLARLADHRIQPDAEAHAHPWACMRASSAPPAGVLACDSARSLSGLARLAGVMPRRLRAQASCEP